MSSPTWNFPGEFRGRRWARGCSTETSPWTGGEFPQSPSASLIFSLSTHYSHPALKNGRPFHPGKSPTHQESSQIRMRNESSFSGIATQLHPPLNETILWEKDFMLGASPLLLLRLFPHSESWGDVTREQAITWFDIMILQQTWSSMCSVTWLSPAPCCLIVVAVEAGNEMCFYWHSLSLTDTLRHIVCCVRTVACDVYFTMWPPPPAPAAVRTALRVLLASMEGSSWVPFSTICLCLNIFITTYGRIYTFIWSFICIHLTNIYTSQFFTFLFAQFLFDSKLWGKRRTRKLKWWHFEDNYCRWPW